MSTINPNEIISYWGKCPTDILLIIFKKLDKQSLFNSMCVNKYWQDIGEYYCDHFDAWKMIIDGATNNTTVTHRDKSKLGCKHIVKSALRWYNVKNCALHLHQQYDFKGVRDICVYKDNLIVAENDVVKYYNLESSQFKGRLYYTCVKYIETSSFIVKSTPLEARIIGNVLTVTNKLHYTGCNCRKPYQIMFFDVTLWRVNYKSCYIMNKENVLRRFKVEKCSWHVEVLAYYAVDYSAINGMNIYHKDIYLLMWNNTVSLIDYRGLPKEVYQLDVFVHNPNSKNHMLNTYTAICLDLPEGQLQMKARKAGVQTVVACPGLTCAIEHGHMLLLGYEDGKIQIFRTTNLPKQIHIPELQFYLCSYAKTKTNKIIAIDVYDDRDCHHVFVATESSVYQFFICDN